MGWQDTTNAGLWLPGLPLNTNINTSGVTFQTTSNTAFVSANASAKIALIGNVWFPAKTGSKNIQNVTFRTGSTVTNGTSTTARVSIQGWGTSGGNPPQPDGTIKGASNNGFTTFGLGDSGLAATTNFTPASNFGAVVPVNWGDPIAVVFDWSSAGTSGVSRPAGSVLRGTAIPLACR
jgi:hypothetical protein